MSKETSGTAFPVENHAKASQYGSFGMSLRDYFAAKAMQGLLISTRTDDVLMICRDAYKIADAMLEARK